MLCAYAAFAQSPETYKARLSRVPVEAKTQQDITGLGSATATLMGSKLTITGSFDGLKTAALDAKIHLSPLTGVRGPAILDATVDHKTSGQVSGTVELTPQQVEALHKGRLYIQIDSEKAPDGNLWGWLLR